MFVPMMQGYPLSTVLPEETGLGDRFWYWRGASGQPYIHSIYRLGHCPPVPGAVFILVDVSGGVRRAIAVGRFDAGGALPDVEGQEHMEHRESLEVHVHLLARDEMAAEHLREDLQAALSRRAAEAHAFSQQTPLRKAIQLELLAA